MVINNKKFQFSVLKGHAKTLYTLLSLLKLAETLPVHFFNKQVYQFSLCTNF
jgi:hypothetical protein